jgi:hypothetical protein
MRGWNVGAFQNFEEALAWLADNEPADLEPDARQQKIPIKITRARTSKLPANRNVGNRVYAVSGRQASA